LLALALLLAGSMVYLLLPLRTLSTLPATSALVGIVGFISVFVLVTIILNPLGREFPRGCETFGDFVKLTLARNYERLAPNHGMSSEKEVLQSLLQLIAAEVSSDVNGLSSNTLFPEGLHIY